MEADAYTVALEIPTVLFSVVTMAIKTVLIPSYSRLLYNEGKERTDRFFSNILNLCLIVSIAALGYASTLSKAASCLFVICVSAITYPVMTELPAKKGYEGLSAVYVRGLSLFLHITVPIFFGALILRTRIVQLVYARGAFGQDAVTLTATLFIFYFITILFSGLRQTSARLFYSFGDTAAPMKNTVIGLGANIVLNIILSRLMGAVGLALERLLPEWNILLRLLLCIAVGAAVYLAALLLLRSEEVQWLLRSLLKKRRGQKGSTL